jgi:hypothetical protein
VYVLGCGGGVLVHVEDVLAGLKTEYGERELLRLSLKVLFESPAGARYLEGVESAALTIVCYLGDRALLQRLVDMRSASISRGLKWEENMRWQTETIIVGLCSRLRLCLPEGIVPWNDQALGELFC